MSFAIFKLTTYLLLTNFDLSSEIVGKTYISIIHPNDVNQLMKDLKDAGTSNAQTVSLLYRVRRKFSGYIWIESIGKIHGAVLSSVFSRI